MSQLEHLKVSDFPKSHESEPFLLELEQLTEMFACGPQEKLHSENGFSAFWIEDGTVVEMENRQQVANRSWYFQGSWNSEIASPRLFKCLSKTKGRRLSAENLCKLYELFPSETYHFVEKQGAVRESDLLWPEPVRWKSYLDVLERAHERYDVEFSRLAALRSFFEAPKIDFEELAHICFSKGLPVLYSRFQKKLLAKDSLMFVRLGSGISRIKSFNGSYVTLTNFGRKTFQMYLEDFDQAELLVFSTAGSKQVTEDRLESYAIFAVPVTIFASMLLMTFGYFTAVNLVMIWMSLAVWVVLPGFLKKYYADNASLIVDINLNLSVREKANLFWQRKMSETEVKYSLSPTRVGAGVLFFGLCCSFSLNVISDTVLWMSVVGVSWSFLSWEALRSFRNVSKVNEIGGSFEKCEFRRSNPVGELSHLRKIEVTIPGVFRSSLRMSWGTVNQLSGFSTGQQARFIDRFDSYAFENGWLVTTICGDQAVASLLDIFVKDEDRAQILKMKKSLEGILGADQILLGVARKSQVFIFQEIFTRLSNEKIHDVIETIRGVLPDAVVVGLSQRDVEHHLFNQNLFLTGEYLMDGSWTESLDSDNNRLET